MAMVAEQIEHQPLDPVASAKAAHLRYVTDTRPGIRRVRDGDEFVYIRPDDTPVTDEAELARIKALGIPPAWTDVWISPLSYGHLQATGRDARGRKQYRYHERWRAVRDEQKFERMLAFGAALPLIRARTEEHLALPGLPREKVLATVVRLLESTLIRVGNEEYARQNGSFGLTTMREQHVDVAGATVQFQFRGKSGKDHSISVRDRRLAHIVRRLQSLPGQSLFQYRDDDGTFQTIESSDVNDYVQEITGQEFTAKDFRTWAGTVLAAEALQTFESFDSETQAKKNVMCAIEAVASRLGNTPTICRKCYVHPAVLDAYLDGSTLQTLKERVNDDMIESLHALKPEEAAVMGLLQQRLTTAADQEQKRPRVAKKR